MATPRLTMASVLRTYITVVVGGRPCDGQLIYQTDHWTTNYRPNVYKFYLSKRVPVQCMLITRRDNVTYTVYSRLFDDVVTDSAELEPLRIGSRTTRASRGLNSNTKSCQFSLMLVHRSSMWRLVQSAARHSSNASISWLIQMRTVSLLT